MVPAEELSPQVPKRWLLVQKEGGQANTDADVRQACRSVQRVNHISHIQRGRE